MEWEECRLIRMQTRRFEEGFRAVDAGRGCSGYCSHKTLNRLDAMDM